MAKRLIQLKIEHVAGVDRPANKRKFLVVKSEQSDKGEVMLTQEQINKIADKDVQAAVLKQREELIEVQNKTKSLEDEVEKLKTNQPPPPEGNPDEEEFWKGVPAVHRNRYEAQKKRAEAFEQAAKEQKDRNETAEWVGKLKKVTYVPIIAERFAPIMKNIAQTYPKEAKEVIDVFTACDEIISKGAIIFKELGSSGNDGDATDVVSRVQAMAKEIEKRDKVDNATATQRVFSEHPEWYGPYRKRSIAVGHNSAS